MCRALVTAISCIFVTVSVARAEPLPGTFEVGFGHHAMLLVAQSCEHDAGMVTCRYLMEFAGFEYYGRVQLGPQLALGLRAAASIELGNSTDAAPSNTPGHILQRQLLLWQFALQARFDPAIRIRGLWLGAEIGAALAVDGFDEGGVDGPIVDTVLSATPALLLAAVAGYDIALDDGYTMGFELRGEYLSLQSVPGRRTHFGTREFEPLPYVSLGAHGGVRW